MVSGPEKERSILYFTPSSISKSMKEYNEHHNDSFIRVNELLFVNILYSLRLRTEGRVLFH